MILGEGDFQYELVPEWSRQLAQWNVGIVPGICIDDNERLYVLSRGVPPVFVMDTEGNCLSHWGDDDFVRAHGVFLNHDHTIYCADDNGHAVYKFDPNHNHVMTLGTKGVPSDTGCVDKKLDTIVRSAGPFHYPTNAAVAKNGDIYVSDGYGNARIHVFSPKGELKFGWGEPGVGPGQFRLPHSLRFGPDETLYVCDRANNRIQLFDKDGHYLDQWTDFLRPADLFIARDGIVYVSECKSCPVFNEAPSRVTILNLKGDILARIGGNEPFDHDAASRRSAHGIAVDSEQNLYVAEVGAGFPAGYIGLQKYRRLKK